MRTALSYQQDAGVMPGRQKLTAIAAMIFLLAFAAVKTFAGEDVAPVAGWIERAMLFPHGLTLPAKLDSGAKTTSINAIDSVFFTRDGRRWARFSLTDHDGRTATLERPVVRVATIRRHFGASQERPVIHLDICIGPVRKTVEVNLMDRSGLNSNSWSGVIFLLVIWWSTLDVPFNCRSSAPNRRGNSRSVC